eukprot:7890797-Prorocentrum_lima.AAC.1
MSNLHQMNTFQSQELTAQRGMVNNLMHHMEQYVGNLSAHSTEQTVNLKQCEAESAEQISRVKNVGP